MVNSTLNMTFYTTHSFFFANKLGLPRIEQDTIYIIYYIIYISVIDQYSRYKRTKEEVCHQECDL